MLYLHFVFGKPESFLTNPDVRDILRDPDFRKRVTYIVFDEVHTAVSWYADFGFLTLCFCVVLNLA